MRPHEIKSKRRCVWRTDLLDPIDQVSFLILNETGYDDAHLLSPGVTFRNLNFRRRFFLPLDQLFFRFPTRELFPVTAVLWI
jgi:hypothetical protein